MRPHERIGTGRATGLAAHAMLAANFLVLGEERASSSTGPKQLTVLALLVDRDVTAKRLGKAVVPDALPRVLQDVSKRFVVTLAGEHVAVGFNREAGVGSAASLGSEPVLAGVKLAVHGW